jgi:exopolyphosphatase/guanosine-5'-triphosphate,3'-diphosphate pyrophosphatase
VRMLERFSADPAAPLSATAAGALAAHVREAITDAGFRLALPAGGRAVGTGGTFSTARAMLAARTGQDFARSDPVLRVADLRQLSFVGRLPLAERRAVPGLPAGRADIFPVALVTVLAVAELGGYDAFRHSAYNLRWGVAAELLA